MPYNIFLISAGSVQCLESLDDLESCGISPAVCSGEPNDSMCLCTCDHANGFSGGIQSASGLLCKSKQFKIIQF